MSDSSSPSYYTMDSLKSNFIDEMIIDKKPNEEETVLDPIDEADRQRMLLRLRRYATRRQIDDEATAEAMFVDKSGSLEPKKKRKFRYV